MPAISLADACQIGERVRHSITSELFHINRDSKIRVTASVGIASLEGPHDSLEQLLARADGAQKERAATGWSPMPHSRRALLHSS